MAKDKKQAILDSALTLFVTQGYHATSTATLAKTAGVATGTLFHHFPNKEAVLQALYLQVKSEFAELMKTALLGKDLRHTFSDLWCLGINWALKNTEKAQFFQQYCMSPDLDATEREKVLLEVFGFLAEMVIKGQAVGLFHNYPLILMMETCYGQFLASTRYFMDHPERWQEQEYRDSSFAMAWGAMSKEPVHVSSTTAVN